MAVALGNGHKEVADLLIAAGANQQLSIGLFEVEVAASDLKQNQVVGRQQTQGEVCDYHHSQSTKIPFFHEKHSKFSLQHETMLH